MKNRLLSLILALCLSVSVCSVGFVVLAEPDYAVWDGSVSQTAPEIIDGVYQIGTGAELAWLAAQVDAKSGVEIINNKTASKIRFNAVLTADIYLNDINAADWEKNPNTWNPIGEEDYEDDSEGYTVYIPYSGIFDGAGHTVYGLYINQENYGAGLFSCVYDAVISDLNIDGAFVSGTEDVGVICANINECKILNCTVSNAAVAADKYVGIIIGYAENSTISKAMVKACTITAKDYIGGIVGESFNAVIEECETDEDCIVNGIEDIFNIGGIVGVAYGTKIKDCVNRAQTNGVITEGFDLEGSDTSLGGIVGRAWVDTLVTNCKNYGKIYDAYECGGIVGTSEDAEVNYCANYAEVYASFKASSIGGIIGYNCGNINNCVNYGDVGTNDYMAYNKGGICGYDDAYITQSYCANAGDVGYAKSAGGLVGYNESTYQYSFNTGDVYAETDETSYTGGLVGYNCCGAFYNCYSAGAIIDPVHYAENDIGALCGYNDSGYNMIDNCFYIENGIAPEPYGEYALVYGVSQDELKSSETMDRLNSESLKDIFLSDYYGEYSQMDGFPVLFWMHPDEVFTVSYGGESPAPFTVRLEDVDPETAGYQVYGGTKLVFNAKQDGKVCVMMVDENSTSIVEDERIICVTSDTVFKAQSVRDTVYTRITVENNEMFDIIINDENSNVIKNGDFVEEDTRLYIEINNKKFVGETYSVFESVNIKKCCSDASAEDEETTFTKPYTSIKTEFWYDEFVISVQAIERDRATDWDGVATCEPVRKGGVYQIYYPDELAWFCENDDDSSVDSIELMADINLAQADGTLNKWNGIYNGIDSYGMLGFSGSFNGNGHIIRNLYTNNNSGGLFKNVFNSDIGNFTLEGVELHGYEMGAVADSVNNSKISDVTVKGLNASNENVNTYAGGICTFLWNSSLNNCRVYNSTINGANMTVGGISGDIDNGSIINGCLVVGVKIVGSIAGGIAGNCTVGSVVNSGVYGGSITFSNINNDVCAVGGIIAIINASQTIIVKSCVAITDIYSGSATAGAAFGICTQAQISDCYVRGNIIGDGEVGGFAGYFNYSSAVRCYSASVFKSETNNKSRAFAYSLKNSGINTFYYLEQGVAYCFVNEGNGDGIINIFGLSMEAMKGAQMLEALNNTEETQFVKAIENSLPVLEWEKAQTADEYLTVTINNEEAVYEVEDLVPNKSGIQVLPNTIIAISAPEERVIDGITLSEGSDSFVFDNVVYVLDSTDINIVIRDKKTYTLKLKQVEGLCIYAFSGEEQIYNNDEISEFDSISIQVEKDTMTGDSAYTSLSKIMVNDVEYKGSYTVGGDEPVITVSVIAQKITSANREWDGTSIATPSTDEDGVYLIYFAQELAWFEQEVNSTDYSIINARLMADIYLNDKPWKPIDNYYGTFDGNGFTVYDLKIRETINSNSYVGFFGVAEDATIRNLTVQRANINVDCEAGVIVGKATRCTLENVAVLDAVIISGDEEVGGIIGYNYSSSIIDAVVRDCTITVSDEEVGGVIGYSTYDEEEVEYTLENILVQNVKIKATQDEIGGVIGDISGDCQTMTNITVDSCVIQGETTDIGGVVGDDDDTDYSDITVTNTQVILDDPSDDGCLSAVVSETSYLNIDKVYLYNNTVKVINGQNAITHAGGIIGYGEGCISNVCAESNNISAAYAGGIAGYINDDCVIFDTEVIGGEIKGDYIAGGIVADFFEESNVINITNVSVVDSEITAKEIAGGILGKVYDAGSFNINSCINQAKTVNAPISGGIIGCFNNKSDSTIKNCINSGSVTATADTNRPFAVAGGIIGKMGEGSNFEAVKCINNGSVSAISEQQDANASGFVGQCENNTTISVTGFYVTGSVVASAKTAAKAGGFIACVNINSNTVNLANGYFAADVKTEKVSENDETILLSAMAFGEALALPNETVKLYTNGVYYLLNTVPAVNIDVADEDVEQQVNESFISVTDQMITSDDFCQTLNTEGATLTPTIEWERLDTLNNARPVPAEIPLTVDFLSDVLNGTLLLANSADENFEEHIVYGRMELVIGTQIKFALIDNPDYDISKLKVFASGKQLEPDENGVYTLDVDKNTVVTIKGVTKNTYSVTYKSGLDGVDDIVVNNAVGSDTVISDCKFEKEGYRFLCWNTMADASGTSYTTAQVLSYEEAESLELYAIWKKVLTEGAGDVSGDGIVGADDALSVLQASVNKLTLTSEQFALADVNGDDDITGEDALLILQYSVNKIESF